LELEKGVSPPMGLDPERSDKIEKWHMQSDSREKKVDFLIAESFVSSTVNYHFTGLREIM
jgi:hypothetical protein